MLQPDGEGTYKFNGKEYTAFLRLCAAWTAVKEVKDILKDRIKVSPLGELGWCWINTVETFLRKITEAILKTVPTKKLVMIDREVKAVRVRLHIGPDASQGKNDQVVCVNEDAFLALLDQVVAMNCMLCDKHGKEVKKCPWLKLIEDCLPYSPDPEQDPEDGTCQIAGRTSIIDEGE